jgi:hypothetical protein
MSRTFSFYSFFVANGGNGSNRTTTSPTQAAPKALLT